MIVNDIFEQVREEILKSDMPLTQIAKKSGLSCRAIQYWLTGERTITVEAAQCVLAVLGKELRIEERQDNGTISQ